MYKWTANSLSKSISNDEIFSPSNWKDSISRMNSSQIDYYSRFPKLILPEKDAEKKLFTKYHIKKLNSISKKKKKNTKKKSRKEDDDDSTYEPESGHTDSSFYIQPEVLTIISEDDDDEQTTKKKPNKKKPKKTKKKTNKNKKTQKHIQKKQIEKKQIEKKPTSPKKRKAPEYKKLATELVNDDSIIQKLADIIKIESTESKNRKKFRVLKVKKLNDVLKINNKKYVVKDKDYDCLWGSIKSSNGVRCSQRQIESRTTYTHLIMAISAGLFLPREYIKYEPKYVIL